MHKVEWIKNKAAQFGKHCERDIKSLMFRPSWGRDITFKILMLTLHQYYCQVHLSLYSLTANHSIFVIIISRPKYSVKAIGMTEMLVHVTYPICIDMNDKLHLWFLEALF